MGKIRGPNGEEIQAGVTGMISGVRGLSFSVLGSARSGTAASIMSAAMYDAILINRKSLDVTSAFLGTVAQTHSG
jgi:hypothetical protein